MKFLLILPCLLLFSKCAQIQSDFRDAAITANGGGNCRTYPTGYTTGGNAYTCSWNGTALQLTCTGPTTTGTIQYPSLQKFIDEPKVVGRFFLNKITITGSGPSTSTYSYDASDRLTGISVSAPSLTSMTYSYSAFDAQGRPTSGQYNISASGFNCVNANIVRSYNDSARTMTEAITGGTGLLCFAITTTSTFDAETGIDTLVVASPGGTTTKTVTGKAQVCL
ncbi:MAG: hypothetical protein LDLANPLL_02578 [Turneriella sp.]|nr:hypothetical protein [Turneriella sp.]